MKTTLANPPSFWTKTDLRTIALIMYTMQQKVPKTTRPEAQERVCFVTRIETRPLFFPLWRDCRGIGPIEGTEIAYASVHRTASHSTLQRHWPD